MPHHIKPGVYALGATMPAGHILKVDLADKNKIADVLQAIGKALAFPGWYGANFDALVDCLADPAWLPAEPHILFSGLDGLHHAAPEDFETLLEVLRAAIQARRAAGSSLIIVIDSDHSGLPACPSA